MFYEFMLYVKYFILLVMIFHLKHFFLFLVIVENKKEFLQQTQNYVSMDNRSEFILNIIHYNIMIVNVSSNFYF